MEGILVLVGIGFGIWLLSKISSAFEKAGRYERLKPKLDNLEEIERNLKNEIDKFKRSRDIEIQQWNTKVKTDQAVIEKLYRQKSMGFPWLASAYADYFALAEKKVEDYLQFKKRPAFKAAEAVKEAAKRRREVEQKYRVARYKIEYYENLFPWLSDLLTEDEEEDFLVSVDLFASDNVDSAQQWLTQEEYKKLPNSEKYQLALERYAKKRKTKWEIGRDYERYVGYMWESNGYAVTYQGIIDGFEDLGRDLIAREGNEVDVIQCKYWSKHKVIHEKHIFQLFGTTMELWLKNNKNKSSPKSLIEFANLLMDERVKPIFITSTNLSEMARKMANTLNVIVYENYAMNEYPRIKCNVSGRNKEKIYHLPFDQQYDKVVIEPEKGEFYAGTVKEAEKAGYRRAIRWKGNK
jgi:hypothetical protein